MFIWVGIIRIRWGTSRSQRVSLAQLPWSSLPAGWCMTQRKAGRGSTCAPPKHLMPGTLYQSTSKRFGERLRQGIFGIKEPFHQLRWWEVSSPVYNAIEMEMPVGYNQLTVMMCNLLLISPWMTSLGKRPTALNTSDTKHNQLKKKQKQINIQADQRQIDSLALCRLCLRQLHLLETSTEVGVLCRWLHLIRKIHPFFNLRHRCIIKLNENFSLLASTIVSTHMDTSLAQSILFIHLFICIPYL